MLKNIARFAERKRGLSGINILIFIQTMKNNSEISKILSGEHENILKVVDALESEIGKLNNKNINALFFRKVIDFIRNYADKFHHAKEEDILFKEFNKCAEEGRVHCNPVEQMLVEHDEGRRCVKMMELGLDENNKEELIKGSGGYINLIREHILKEDNILYPMIEETLGDKTKKSIIAQFNKINNLKKREIERFEKFVKEIKQSNKP